ncbi:hypothetical protein ABI_46590 [Asticcacaulis biprosthecium C19]|uniref:Uncharacterized protein n=1 Tax=Asticcacaulis biprosthecium C19 TaxID=715226 RepID=F4QU10_9CAUL|nr:hypothetical protein ABI_46590 [Asticcacaulis biprosthecium C19]
MTASIATRTLASGFVGRWDMERIKPVYGVPRKSFGIAVTTAYRLRRLLDFTPGVS